MATVIDRRPNGKNKSAINRGRFLDRYKDKIKEAVARSVQGRSITDMEKGDSISIPSKDINEPFIGHDNGGVWDSVKPGNKEYQVGDRFKRPKGGGGSGGASDSSDPLEDDFAFTLSKEEFMKYFFEGLELPDLVKKQLCDTEDVKHHRAGFKTSGATTNLHVLRTLRGSLGRRIAVGGKSAKRLEEARIELEFFVLNGVPWTDSDVIALLEEIKSLKAKLAKIPFIDTFDLRYSNTVEVPQPSAKAVMFCLMDVSGSMGMKEKDIAKRFFVLLYLFLTKAYKNIEVVFIRHHTEAREVDEKEFFEARDSGGTIVSSALSLMHDIIAKRYSGAEYNIYAAQASDGDNFSSDTAACGAMLREKIIPMLQYFAYIEIAEGNGQNLWDEYSRIAKEYKTFNVRRVEDLADIYPVFCDLFKKKEN